MQRNFKIIWWFGIAQKEIAQRKIEIKDIIDKYYNSWITEFFMGYNPSYWHNDYGFEFSPNWRFGENEQITSYETFKKAVDYIHTLKDANWNSCEIFVAINFFYYSDVTMPLIQKIIDEVISAEVDGIIVSTREVLQYLSDIWFQGRINLSTIMPVYNAETVQFLIDEFKELKLNLNRFILPRELTLQEIKSITEKFPDYGFEVFGQGDYCRYANGYCLSEHKYFSRDLCTFVLKHWINVRRAIKYDFKKVILNTELDENTKHDLLDNSLRDITEIFVSQNLMDFSEKNALISEYLQSFENNFYGAKDFEEIKYITQKIYILMKTDLAINYFKYIYDGMQDSTCLHNSYIDSFLALYHKLREYIQIEEDFVQKIDEIKTLRKNAIAYYQDQIKTKWKFGIQTLYKFMLYNRTSVPFYKFFNDIKNIEVVKIPLRWRDLTLFKLWIELIDQWIENPEKFIDQWNICAKYFHYDPSKLELYQQKLEHFKNN